MHKNKIKNITIILALIATSSIFNIYATQFDDFIYQDDYETQFDDFIYQDDYETQFDDFIYQDDQHSKDETTKVSTTNVDFEYYERFLEDIKKIEINSDYEEYLENIEYDINFDKLLKEMVEQYIKKVLNILDKKEYKKNKIKIMSDILQNFIKKDILEKIFKKNVIDIDNLVDYFIKIIKDEEEFKKIEQNINTIDEEKAEIIEIMLIKTKKDIYEKLKEKIEEIPTKYEKEKEEYKFKHFGEDLDKFYANLQKKDILCEISSHDSSEKIIERNIIKFFEKMKEYLHEKKYKDDEINNKLYNIFKQFAEETELKSIFKNINKEKQIDIKELASFFIKILQYEKKDEKISKNIEEKYVDLEKDIKQDNLSYCSLRNNNKIEREKKLKACIKYKEIEIFEVMFGTIYEDIYNTYKKS